MIKSGTRTLDTEDMEDTEGERDKRWNRSMQYESSIVFCKTFPEGSTYLHSAIGKRCHGVVFTVHPE